MKDHTWEYIPEFAAALTSQLQSDEKEWGGAWRDAPTEGLDERIAHHVEDYFLRAKYGHPIPWLQVAGYALIAWARARELETSDLRQGDSHKNLLP